MSERTYQTSLHFWANNAPIDSGPDHVGRVSQAGTENRTLEQGSYTAKPSSISSDQFKIIG